MGAQRNCLNRPTARWNEINVKFQAMFKRIIYICRNHFLLSISNRFLRYYNCLRVTWTFYKYPFSRRILLNLSLQTWCSMFDYDKRFILSRDDCFVNELSDSTADSLAKIARSCVESRIRLNISQAERAKMHFNAQRMLFLKRNLH